MHTLVETVGGGRFLGGVGVKTLLSPIPGCLGLCLRLFPGCYRGHVASTLTGWGESMLQVPLRGRKQRH